MTDTELRKLGRRELLQLLLEQGRELEALKALLESTQAQLRSREIYIDKAGSIAEAAMGLNGVFEAAQNAAQQYLENIRRQSENVEELCRRREAECERREAESKRRIEEETRAAALAAKQLDENTKRRCAELEAEAKAKADAYWNDTTRRLLAFYNEHEELKRLFVTGGKNEATQPCRGAAAGAHG